MTSTITFLVTLLILFSINSTAEIHSNGNQSCEQLNATIPVLQSREVEYFKKLIELGADVPLSNFLHLWYPDKNNNFNDDETYFLKCISPYSSIIANYRMEKTCEPDTLYSWGPKSKILTLQDSMPDQSIWEGNPNPYSNQGIWATMSPVSTFSYGLVPVRLKLKKQAQFNDPRDSHSGISMSLNYGLMDFIITNAEDLDSWSYGTAEHYDEIVRDIIRIQSGKNVLTYKSVTTMLLKEEQKFSAERLWQASIGERSEQNEKNLKLSLIEMIKMILNNEGRIFYQKGSCRNLQKHFSTSKPTYFNQNINQTP